MTERGHTILNKRIARLPEYCPDDSLWKSIEVRLDFEKQLLLKIADLPDYMPSGSVWEKIEKRDIHEKIRLLRKQYLYYAASVAVLLIISGVIVRKITDKGVHDVHFTTELSYPVTNISRTENRWPEPAQYINSLCRLNTEVCTSPEFLEKKKMLEQLNEDEKEVLRYEAAYGSSETLEKSKIRIEKVRAGIIKELLNMIEG